MSLGKVSQDDFIPVARFNALASAIIAITNGAREGADSSDAFVVCTQGFDFFREIEITATDINARVSHVLILPLLLCSTAS